MITNSKSAFFRDAQLLLHPYFILTLLILIVNDNVGKIAYPGLLTGKLSDFSGLFVVSVFVYVILSSRLRTGRQITYICGAIGLLFTLWKIAPLEIPLAALERIFNIPVPHRTKDITDLIALTVLPLAYIFIERQRNSARAIQSRNVFKSTAIYGILVITGFSIIATSPAYRNANIRVNYSIDNTLKKNHQLFLFEQTILDEGMNILGRQIASDSSLVYTIGGDFVFVDSAKTGTESDNYYPVTGRSQQIELVIANYYSSQNLKITGVRFGYRYGHPSESSVLKVVDEKIVRPFNEKIAAFNATK
jgi:hypothetical protein